ncbi:hypothetical protein CY35_01G120300 [Sphagnum magellanicum]|nr:hypothetical protein CY35_01G120300 [Sphagnum magellanicum]
MVTKNVWEEDVWSTSRVHHATRTHHLIGICLKEWWIKHSILPCLQTKQTAWSGWIAIIC